MKQVESAARANGPTLRWSGVAFGLGCLLSGSLVSAVDKQRYDAQGAAAVCQPSLPQYETNLRSRPLGIANQGTEMAFVTCTWRTGTAATDGRGSQDVIVAITNNDIIGKAVTCTLVTGSQSGGTSTAVYTPRTLGVAPTGGLFIDWFPGYLNPIPPEIFQPAVICGLPGKTTLQYTGIVYGEDVGT